MKMRQRENGAGGAVAAVSRWVSREAYWRDQLRRQEASGLSVCAYCKSHGLSSWSLYEWRRRLRVAAERGGAKFAEVGLAGSCVARGVDAVGSGVEVIVRDAVRVSVAAGFDEATLVRVVRALAQC